MKAQRRLFLLLKVIDAFTSGDRFEIFDFGTSLGITSLIPRGAFSDCADDPISCLVDAVMSKGFFKLGAGDHSLTVVAFASPNGLGSAYFQVAAGAVPEPTSLLLAALGLAVLVVPRTNKYAAQEGRAA